jgi:hypothetical protein
MHNLNSRKSSSTIWATSVIFQKTAQRQQSPIELSFVQSGHPGANPTIASYNASVVNFNNTTGSLVRFENKNIISYF